MKSVNLSRRPFVNSRPVVRLAALLWLLGLGLLALNLWLYFSHFSGSASTRAQLAEVQGDIDGETESLGELGGKVRGLALDDQNRQVGYLNQLIAMRTFPWGRLFDHLGEVLPADVSLISVQPRVQLADPGLKQRRRRRARRAAKAEEAISHDRVELQLLGLAKSEQALAEFVDALFDDPAFQRPNPTRDTYDEKNGAWNFSVNVVYQIDTTRSGGEAGQQLASGTTPDGELVAATSAEAGAPLPGTGSSAAASGGPPSLGGLLEGGGASPSPGSPTGQVAMADGRLGGAGRPDFQAGQGTTPGGGSGVAPEASPGPSGRSPVGSRPGATGATGVPVIVGAQSGAPPQPGAAPPQASAAPPAQGAAGAAPPASSPQATTPAAAAEAGEGKLEEARRDQRNDPLPSAASGSPRRRP